MLWSLECWTRSLKNPAEIMLCLENSETSAGHSPPAASVRSFLIRVSSLLGPFQNWYSLWCLNWISKNVPVPPTAPKPSGLTLHVADRANPPCPVGRERDKESTLKLEKLPMSSSLIGKEGVVCVHEVIMMAVFIFLIIRCSRNIFESKQVKRRRHFLTLTTQYIVWS